MTKKIRQLISDLQLNRPVQYKLYQLAEWLNSQSQDYIYLEDDHEAKELLLKDIAQVTTVEQFIKLLRNYDLMNFEQKCLDDICTLGDIAEGMAWKYITNGVSSLPERI